MKKLLIAILFLPSLAYADRLGSLRSGTEVLLSTQASATTGVINTSTNPVDWSNLKNVPAGFADGVDNTGGGGGTTIVIQDNAATVVETSTINFNGTQFAITDVSGTGTVTIDTNTVGGIMALSTGTNAAGQLLRLNSSADVPDANLPPIPTIYSATGTASFPFGFSASSASFNGWKVNSVDDSYFSIDPKTAGLKVRLDRTEGEMVIDSDSASPSELRLQSSGGSVHLVYSQTSDAFSINKDTILFTGKTLKLNDSVDGKFVGLKSSATLSLSNTYVLPASSGTAGQAILTDGSNNLYFGTAGSGDIEGVTAGSGLVGGGTSGTVALSLDPSATHYIQNTDSMQEGASFYVRLGVIDQTDGEGYAALTLKGPYGTNGSFALEMVNTSAASASNVLALPFSLNGPFGSAIFGQMQVASTDVGMGSDDGSYEFYPRRNGSLKKLLTLRGSDLATLIGAGEAGIDYALIFDGETNDGTFTWMEDEDYFQSDADIVVPTEVYDATGWDGDLSVPTKDAIRDKIETISGGSGDNLGSHVATMTITAAQGILASSGVFTSSIGVGAAPSFALHVQRVSSGTVRGVVSNRNGTSGQERRAFLSVDGDNQTHEISLIAGKNPSNSAFEMLNGTTFIQFGTGGAERARMTAAGAFSAGDGTPALPAWSFNSDTNNGLYRPTTDQVGMVAGGVVVATYTIAGQTSSTITVATTLTIPNGTNPAVDTVGQMAVDTSSGQVVFHDGTNTVVWSATTTKSMTIETPALGDFPFFWRAATDQTIQSIHCVSSNATSTSIRVQECDASGASCTDIEAAITCTTTNTSVVGSAIDNAAIDAGDRIRVLVSAVSGTPGWVAIDVNYTETRK